MAELRVARSELILGGQKSGKTARAESLAAAWLARSPEHRAVYIATAQAWDEEMRERIARHQRQRAQRVPRDGDRGGAGGTGACDRRSTAEAIP